MKDIQPSLLPSPPHLPGRLPQRTRIGYGFAESGISGAEVLLRVSLLIYYTDTVGLRPDLAGYAIALCVLWDAITDPMMGWISDNLPIRGQRRRPYIILGAIGLSLTLVMLFSPPDLSSQWAKFIWLFVSYFLVNTTMTIIAVPHSAFAGDLASGSARTGLFGWRLLFGNLGLTLATAIPATPLSMALKEHGLTVDQSTSIIIAALVIVSAIVTVVFSAGRDRAPDSHTGVVHSPLAALASFSTVLRDKAFRSIFFAYFIANIGLTLNSSFALYFYRYRLELDETATRTIIALFMGVFCLFIPVWILVSRRFPKKNLLLINIALLGLMTMIVYPLLPVGNSQLPLIASVLGGIFVAAVVLLEVVVAELAESADKNAPFGIYFGMWKMGAKLSRAAALVFTGHLLQGIGFVPNALQSPQTSQYLAILFGPCVGILLLTSSAMIGRVRIGAN